MLRARSPLGVFRGSPPFDRQPARLSDRGPPQPAPELCGSRRCLQGLGLSVVGGATPGRDTGKRSKEEKHQAEVDRLTKLLAAAHAAPPHDSEVREVLGLYVSPGQYHSTVGVYSLVSYQ